MRKSCEVFVFIDIAKALKGTHSLRLMHSSTVDTIVLLHPFHITFVSERKRPWLVRS
jgi:hypothetical protein